MPRLIIPLTGVPMRYRRTRGDVRPFPGGTSLADVATMVSIGTQAAPLVGKLADYATAGIGGAMARSRASDADAAMRQANDYEAERVRKLAIQQAAGIPESTDTSAVDALIPGAEQGPPTVDAGGISPAARAIWEKRSAEEDAARQQQPGYLPPYMSDWQQTDAGWEPGVGFPEMDLSGGPAPMTQAERNARNAAEWQAMQPEHLAQVNERPFTGVPYAQWQQQNPLPQWLAQYRAANPAQPGMQVAGQPGAPGPVPPQSQPGMGQQPGMAPVQPPMPQQGPQLAPGATQAPQAPQVYTQDGAGPVDDSGVPYDGDARRAEYDRWVASQRRAATQASVPTMERLRNEALLAARSGDAVAVQDVLDRFQRDGHKYVAPESVMDALTGNHVKRAQQELLDLVTPKGKVMTPAEMEYLLARTADTRSRTADRAATQPARIQRAEGQADAATANAIIKQAQSKYADVLARARAGDAEALRQVHQAAADIAAATGMDAALLKNQLLGVKIRTDLYGDTAAGRARQQQANAASTSAAARASQAGTYAADVADRAANRAAPGSGPVDRRQQQLDDAAAKAEAEYAVAEAVANGKVPSADDLSAAGVGYDPRQQVIAASAKDIEDAKRKLKGLKANKDAARDAAKRHRELNTSGPPQDF